MEAYFRERGWPTSARAMRFTPRWSSGVWVSVTCFSQCAFAQVLVITGGTDSIFADRG